MSAKPQAAERSRIGGANSLGKPLLSRLFPYFLITPTLVLVVMFTIWPSAKSIEDSTMQPPIRRGQEEKFVGLDNYRDLFDSEHYVGVNFTRIFKNTIVFVAVTVGISTPLALAFALLLNRRIPYLGVWRFSLFYPTMLPLLGAANIWAFLYADNSGLFNTVLRSLGFSGINWLGDPQYTLFSIIVVIIWKQAGYFMIFYLAGLQGIPTTIYEAAAIEGAGYWQQLWHITLPLLRRTHLFILVIGFTGAFQTIEQLQALGQGAPNDRSNLLLYYIFQRLPEPRNWGYVNAMTVILVGILLVFTITNFILFERGEDSDT